MAPVGVVSTPMLKWKDGYSLYRCAVANRGSTKQQMLRDLLQFWGYRWQNDSDVETQGPYENKDYEYVHDYGTEHETVTRHAFTKDLAQKNVQAVRLVQDVLIRGQVTVLVEDIALPRNSWTHSWP